MNIGKSYPYFLENKIAAFSLLEVVMSMVIINILLGVIIIGFQLAISTPSKKNIKLATDIAANYLNEISNKEFPLIIPCPNYCNALDFNQSNCIDRTNTRGSYQNICDYHNLVDYGAKDVTGQAIPGLEKFTISSKIITDSSVVLGNLTGSEDINNLKVIRIDIIVFRQNIPKILMSAYKSKNL